MAMLTSGSRNHGADGTPSPEAQRPQRTWALRVALGLVLVNYILSGNGWPNTDPFTYTVTHRPYIDTSWGYQVVLALVERAFGASGMVLMHVGLVLAVFSLMILTTGLLPGESRVFLPLLLLGGLAAEPRFAVRPEMLSYTLLALVLYLLHRHAEGFRSALWLLPAIFLAWTNSHGLFVLGWAALACFNIGMWGRHRRIDFPLLGWTAASIVVGLVNPYGWRALAFPLTLATRMREENIFARNIGEFLSPLEYLRSDQLRFYVVPIVCFLVFAILVVLSVPSLWRQKRFPCVLLCIAFVPLALAMTRNIPPLAVACLPGAVWGLSLDRVLDVFRLRGTTRRWLRHAFLGGVLLTVAGLGLRVMTDAYYISGRRLERFGVGWNTLALPVDAAAYARGAGLPGRMLNHLNFGAYLMWTNPEPVFIDGRLEVMGERFFEEYRNMLASPDGLRDAVRRYGIRWVIFPHRLRPDLLGGLSRHPAWRLVYVDHVAAIFVVRHASTDSIGHDSARRVELPANPVDVASLPGLGGVERPGRAARWLSGLIRRQDYPTHAVSLGVFHFNRAAAARAAADFADAIRQSGGAYYEIYNNLGSALFAEGRLTKARDCYRLYLDELPFYRREPRRRVLKRLAEIEQSFPTE
jgi:hypothetical protein